MDIYVSDTEKMKYTYKGKKVKLSLWLIKHYIMKVYGGVDV
jgi:hypothetical protein